MKDTSASERSRGGRRGGGRTTAGRAPTLSKTNGLNATVQHCRGGRGKRSTNYVMRRRTEDEEDQRKIPGKVT